MKSLEVINKNANGIENTFVFHLNEGTFDEKSYWEYFSAINSFNGDTRSVDRNIMASYCKVQSYVQNILASHYNQNDLYTIKNLENKRIRDYWNRLTTIFSSFGEGAFENDDFDDGLNPPAK